MARLIDHLPTYYRKFLLLEKAVADAGAAMYSEGLVKGEFHHGYRFGDGADSTTFWVVLEMPKKTDPRFSVSLVLRRFAVTYRVADSHEGPSWTVTDTRFPRERKAQPLPRDVEGLLGKKFRKDREAMAAVKALLRHVFPKERPVRTDPSGG